MVSTEEQPFFRKIVDDNQTMYTEEKQMKAPGCVSCNEVFC